MYEDLLAGIKETANNAIKAALNGNYIAWSAYMVEIYQKAEEARECVEKTISTKDHNIEILKEQLKGVSENGGN